MTVAEEVERQRADLTPTERRVADAVLTDPEGVAFGTVATLADRGGASGASVVRLARRLGYDGFVGLQAAVRDDLMRRAVHRIRQPAPIDIIGQTLAVEIENLQRSLGDIDREQFLAAVALLSSRQRRVFAIAGDASAPVVDLFATELAMLRSGVHAVIGSEARVRRGLAEAEPGDVVVAVDIRRYEREVISTTRDIRPQGVELIAVTDSVLAPFAADAITFVASVAGTGPFDSHVGILGVLNALTAGVAARLRTTATQRLDRIDAAWERGETLYDL